MSKTQRLTVFTTSSVTAKQTGSSPAQSSSNFELCIQVSALGHYAHTIDAISAAFQGNTNAQRKVEILKRSQLRQTAAPNAPIDNTSDNQRHNFTWDSAGATTLLQSKCRIDDLSIFYIGMKRNDFLHRAEGDG
ncbi:MAG: hypothetical protein JOS17DRAFT_790960 [Linnemannia elongata]|nr:MAG: hypothetical protein JOS17DRAFT_790960 [Linnemannia elongata]